MKCEEWDCLLLEAGPQPEGGNREIAPPEIFTNLCIF